MGGRILVYSRRGMTRRLADALSERTGFAISEVICPRYRGPLGYLRAHLDIWRGRLPDIRVEPPIGPADLILVGGPVWRGGLALPVLRLLSEARRLPPIAGVFLTRARMGSLWQIERELEGLPSPGQATPPVLSLCAWEVTPRLSPLAGKRIGRFLGEISPMIDRMTEVLRVIGRARR